jgi:hypothetical protein
VIGPDVSEKPQTEKGSAQPPAVRTCWDRLLVAAGALSLVAAAIEGAMKALGGVFKEAKGLTEVLNLPWSTSWATLVHR